MEAMPTKKDNVVGNENERQDGNAIGLDIFLLGDLIQALDLFISFNP